MPMESVTDFIDVCKVAFTRSTIAGLSYSLVGKEFLPHTIIGSAGVLLFFFAPLALRGRINASLSVTIEFGS